jgi:16S rRNA G1207 methylase RsmC
MSRPQPFEFDANKYGLASSHQNEWGSRLIAELSLHDNERILDLGCGDGVLTAKLAGLASPTVATHSKVEFPSLNLDGGRRSVEQ